jgi:hypothetical protein
MHHELFVEGELHHPSARPLAQGCTANIDIRTAQLSQEPAQCSRLWQQIHPKVLIPEGSVIELN